MSHVFVSYVQQDGPRVDRLAEELRRRGTKVWLDRDALVVGDDWETEIRRAIQNGLFFVACFSENFLTRDRTFMNLEVDVAIRELGMRHRGQRWLLPVLLDDIDVTQLWVGDWERLSRIQHLRLYKGWDDGIEQLVVAIEPAVAAGQREAALRETDPPAIVVAEPAPVPSSGRPGTLWGATDAEQQFEHEQESRVASLAFQPEGRLLASAAFDDDSVRLWSLPDGDGVDLRELELTLPHEGVASLAFSPGGQWLATAGSDMAVRIWELDGGEQRSLLRHDETLPPHGRFMPALAFNGTGTLLAAANLTGRLHVWDIESEEELEHTPAIEHVRDIAFAPFDRVLATADADGRGRLRDVDRGRVVLAKPTAAPGFGMQDAMKQVCLSADGHLLATLTSGGECHLWQTKTGREVRDLEPVDVVRIALSRGRRLLAAILKDGTLCAWELDGGREVLRVPHPSQTQQLVFRPDGALIATLGDDHRLRLIDVDEPGEGPRLFDQHVAFDLAFTADSRVLATGGDAIVLYGPEPR